MATYKNNAHKPSTVVNDHIYSEMTTCQGSVHIPLPVTSDHIYSELKTDYKSDVFTHADTNTDTKKKDKLWKGSALALFVVLVITIGILSSFISLQNQEHQDNGEKALTNQEHSVCPNKSFGNIDIRPKHTKENLNQRYLICFIGNHQKAAKTDKSVYIVAEKDFELYIFQKDLNSTPTYIEVKTQMAKVKKINVPYTMMLSYFKVEEKAILIETTIDAFVIIIDDYKLSSDSAMVLPVKHLSETYIISTIKYSSPKYKDVDFAIAALNNSTEVRIIFRIEPNLPLIVDGIEYQNGSEMIINMNELETYQIRHKADLSGTFIKASSNVAVFSGNSCQKIALEKRNNSGFCSQLVEQIPPVDRLDNTYIAPPNINRYGTILKVVSPFKSRVTYHVDNNKTTVSLLPQGHFEFSITENQVAVIESERPVLLTSFAAGSDTSGDPYMITIPGLTQYLNKYTVITPSNFTSNYVALMIEESSLLHLTLNKRRLIEYMLTFHTPVTVRNVRYIVLVVHVSDGAINVKATNNTVFGLLVYGHRENDGHGFAGNVVLPDLETEYKPDAFIHTDTAAKKDNIRRRYIIALIVVLIICIIIICVLSSILILQNLEQEKKEKACTEGWHQFEDNCYQFSKTFVALIAAVTMCNSASKGTYLLEIRSPEEEKWVKLQMQNQGLATTWMGITDSLEEGTFVFVSSGNNIQNVHANWDEGQPHGNMGENCALLLLGYKGWHDYPCNSKYSYICKKAIV